jgi:pimeloyl-ACP methyl ester carboxylesterase
MKQSRSVFVFFIAITAMACGCGDRQAEYPEPSAHSYDGAFVSTASTIKSGPTEYATDLGTITVAENRSKVTTRLIHLPVLRIHSLSKHPREPIFCLSGGPGQSNMFWDWKGIPYLLSQHDIVIVGYRGADGSTVLACPEVTSALKGGRDPISDESIKAIGQAWSESARRLTGQGVDLDGYTMLEVIEDMESVRRSMAYDRIDLLSGSYGTRVAYLYGLKYPERIHRSAMVGVNPPGHFVWEPEMIDFQLKRYSTLWSQDSIMSQRSSDLYGDIQAVLENMPTEWLFIPINPGKVKVVTFCLLFHRNTAAMVFDAYVAARLGDPSGLALMSVAYDYVMPSMFIWGDLASKGISADFDSTRDYCYDMESPQWPLGSPCSKLMWGPLAQARWPILSLPEECREARQSVTQTLLLSGSIDFSTPAEIATRDLLPYLTNGRQIILSECGHFDDVMNLNPENTRRILTGFLDTGVPDTSMNRYIPMDFSVRWGFPLLAKGALGAVSFLAALVILVVAWLVRKVL